MSGKLCVENWLRSPPEEIPGVTGVTQLHLVPVRQRHVSRAELQMPPGGGDRLSRGGRVRSAHPGAAGRIAWGHGEQEVRRGQVRDARTAADTG